MTNDAENQNMLDRIDALTQLLEEANIAEQYKEIKRTMAETDLANQSRLQKEKLDIEGILYFMLITLLYSSLIVK